MTPKDLATVYLIGAVITEPASVADPSTPCHTKDRAEKPCRSRKSRKTHDRDVTPQEKPDDVIDST